MHRRTESRPHRWLRFAAGVYFAPAVIIGLLLMVIFGLSLILVVVTLLTALLGG